MILWTVQPEFVYAQVSKFGYCLSKRSKSDLLVDELCLPHEQRTFTRAYDWYISEMEKRVSKPSGYELELPWWAYYKLDGNKDITIKDVDHLDNPGDHMIAMKLSVPDNEVLLSDLDLWHIVLNNGYIPDFSLMDHGLNLAYSIKEIDYRFVRDSWERIFDINKYKNCLITTGLDIQATFWVLKRDYIIEAIPFVVKSIL